MGECDGILLHQRSRAVAPRPPAAGSLTRFRDRGITVREAARLQTIPDYAKLSKYRSKNAAIIGDAVPVLLAQKIANSILAAIT